MPGRPITAPPCRGWCCLKVTMPDLSWEISHGRDAGKIIGGLDEVGRGPLAGPVVACVVIVPAHISAP
ncbi:MAG: hypothetical protein EBZ69_06095, partial [Alphaproteobacteria bacterium]|nr:hypothetical protein [Alphaproteobacteria bacterium]